MLQQLKLTRKGLTLHKSRIMCCPVVTITDPDYVDDLNLFADKCCYPETLV